MIKKILKKYSSLFLVSMAFGIIQTLIITKNISSLFQSLLVPLCCYIVAAISLNLVVGISGELSLGHAGFMSLGAFSAICVSSILTNVITNPTLRLFICIIVGMIVAGIFGFLISIPVLKLEGDYLAIVSLAFCEIIRGLLNNSFLGFDSKGLHFSFIDNNLNLLEKGKMLISGPLGATGTLRISSFSIGFVLIIVTLLIVVNLVDSKKGREIMAVRDDKIAGESIGINIVKTKMFAFVLAACLAGAAGALYGLNYSTLTPAKFDYNTSIMLLVYVVLGGLGNINGTIIATTILFVLPQLLTFLKDYRMLIYAIVLIVIMLITNNKKLKNLLDRSKKHE